jgi:hypothetical protein
MAAFYRGALSLTIERFVFIEVCADRLDVMNDSSYYNKKEL